MKKPIPKSKKYCKARSKLLNQRQGHIGISKMEISRKTEISYQTVSEIFKGDNSGSIYNLSLVAKCLKLQMKELF